MELETINRLYLELSQIATAKTARELELESEIQQLRSQCEEMSRLRAEHEAIIHRLNMKRIKLEQELYNPWSNVEYCFPEINLKDWEQK